MHMTVMHSPVMHVSYPLAWLLVAALASTVGPASEAEGAASQRDPVTQIGDRWLAIPFGGQTLRVPLFASGDLAGAHPRIERIVVIVNGTLRNADVYYASALAAARAAGADLARVLIVSPQFLAEPDAKAFPLPRDVPYWTVDSWKEGAPALRPEGGPSSFAVFDAILRSGLDRTRFPALRTVVVAGHSAGGQIVHRYAVAAHADEAVRAAGIDVRYIVSNPSSYLYLDDRRITADGTLAPFPRATCPGFNRYRYGLENAIEYIGRPDGMALARRFAQREVAYLLGGADTDPKAPFLDTTCPAEAQGTSRRERGERFYRYMQLLVGPEAARRQSLHIVPGVGHDHKKMFESPCGLRLLFGDGRCEAE